MASKSEATALKDEGNKAFTASNVRAASAAAAAAAYPPAPTVAATSSSFSAGC